MPPTPNSGLWVRTHTTRDRFTQITGKAVLPIWQPPAFLPCIRKPAGGRSASTLAWRSADVETFVMDHVLMNLPQPPYTEEEVQELAGRIYNFVFQQALAGVKFGGRKAA
jgi:hypothetical protein